MIHRHIEHHFKLLFVNYYNYSCIFFSIYRDKNMHVVYNVQIKHRELGFSSDFRHSRSFDKCILNISKSDSKVKVSTTKNEWKFDQQIEILKRFSLIYGKKTYWNVLVHSVRIYDLYTDHATYVCSTHTVW